MPLAYLIAKDNASIPDPTVQLRMLKETIAARKVNLLKHFYRECYAAFWG